MQFIERWQPFGQLSRFVQVNVTLLTPRLIRLLHAVYGRKTFKDPTYVEMERTRVIWEEATRRGIPMEQLALFGNPIDSYRAYLNDSWIYFESLPIPPRMAARSRAYIDDKFLFKQFLKEHDIPTAIAGMATDLSHAHEQFKKLQLPVVVKPRLGSNSRHTTPLVQTEHEFDKAFRLAQQLGRCVLFEEHLNGHLCRATVVDGKLVGFLESRQPYVTGDGKRTIRELVADKNLHKMERISDVILTGDNEAHIRRQKYELDSIPAEGVSVIVGRLPGRLMGGETHEMPNEIHSKLRQYVEKTAQLLQIPLAGFDLIIPDATHDPDLQRWGILEANTVPFIEIHTDPLYGTPSNVAAAVWDLWEK